MKSYLRFLSRNKLYTAIMAVGLSVSLAFVIIMSCYVWQNLSVSRFYPDADRIYCVGNKGTTYSSFNLGKMLDDRFPEVEMSATVMNRASRFLTRDVLIEQSFFMGVDPDFFEMFPTRFVYGSKEAFNDFGNIIWNCLFLKHSHRCLCGTEIRLRFKHILTVNALCIKHNRKFCFKSDFGKLLSVGFDGSAS